MAERVSAAGLQLSTGLEPNLPNISADRQRINHVFSNLISNAVKHSPPGGTISLRAAANGNEEIRFSVGDQGPGIPSEFQARIFDRFFRVPGQQRTGAGLGLSIAREITVAHGGRIGLESEPGRGSTFYVILRAATQGANGEPGSTE
jgi:signal transduction histidine kinase